VSIEARRLGDASQDVTYEAALTQFVRETVRSANERMRGQSLGRVHATLVSQLEGRFPGVDFDQRQLRRVASAIARGTLTI
jgi:hypothetical protein